MKVKEIADKFLEYGKAINIDMEKGELAREIGLEIINKNQVDVFSILLEYLIKANDQEYAWILQMIFEMHILSEEELLDLYHVPW